MTSLIPPKASLWLIIFIIALPQLSETIYTPSLPDIAENLQTTSSMAEYTLTIYLVGFAFGVLLWGNLSDVLGRKPSLLIGIGLYLAGCVSCFLSSSIEMLMISRFLQAFGGSTGSVLGQAIARDSFAAHERGKVFSSISIAMSFSPALGPIIGGYLDQLFRWRSVFIFLIILGLSVFLSIILRLPETRMKTTSSDQPTLSFFQRAFAILTDKRILSFAFLVGGCNGIIFGYFGEGPFYFIDILKVLPGHYGFLCLSIAGPMVVGSSLSKMMHHREKTSESIILCGCCVTLAGSLLLLGAYTFGIISPFKPFLSVVWSLLFLAFVMVGIAMIIPNCLSQALQKYSHDTGKAASIFGFLYYAIISFMTWMMGAMHNGSLGMMPLFFTGVSLFMVGVYFWILHPRK
jgi:Bcr/CflA subfamily drug resistance transporter